MNKPWLSKSFLSDESQGFSLLEIAVILAVISILSSFAIPNVLRIGKDADLSEAQSLLNSSAADCLQSLRNGKDLAVTEPSPNIISNSRLSSINYKIKSTRNKCINFQVEPSKWCFFGIRILCITQWDSNLKMTD